MWDQKEFHFQFGNLISFRDGQKYFPKFGIVSLYSQNRRVTMQLAKNTKQLNKYKEILFRYQIRKYFIKKENSDPNLIISGLECAVHGPMIILKEFAIFIR